MFAGSVYGRIGGVYAAIKHFSTFPFKYTRDETEPAPVTAIDDAR